MAVFKNFIELKGGLYDTWNLITVIPEEEYDERKMRMVYTIVLNRGSIAKEYRDVVLTYTSKKERDNDLQKCKRLISENETMHIIKDDDTDYDDEIPEETLIDDMDELSDEIEEN